MKINGPGESPLLLLKVIKILKKYRISYAVIGAFAASFYGVIRASIDVDAVISIDGKKDELDKLLSPLIKEGLKSQIHRGDQEDPIRCVINIEDDFQNRVDLLIGIRGMEKNVFKRSVSTTFMKTPIKIISIEDFIAMKIFAGGPKDINDVRGVLKISKNKINQPLMKSLTLHYGKKELEKLKRILQERD